MRFYYFNSIWCNKIVLISVVANSLGKKKEKLVRRVNVGVGSVGQSLIKTSGSPSFSFPIATYLLLHNTVGWL